MNYFVYILSCSNISYYVGHTNNLETRILAHNSGQAANHTAKYRPVKLVYQESQPDKKTAIKRETQIKKWSKAKKQALINRDLDKLHFLSKKPANQVSTLID